MRCEVLAVGTELLLGQIVDTNSSWIGEQLALAGIDSLFQTKVGDNAERIADCLRLALGRSDAVIVCGGLGPTQDDITRDVIAEVMGVELRLDPAIEHRIRTMFESRFRHMPENNLRQAMVPEGASTMAEMPGTAPGLVCPIGDQVVYAVPGVPYEMKEMVLGTVLADLQRRAGVRNVIRSRTLRTWGHSESGMAELLAPYHDELEQSGRCTLAYLASGIEGLKVRLTVKADTEDEARQVLDDETRLVCSVLGDVVFSTDDVPMEQVVLDLCRRLGLTLGTAESLTGGLIASRLTAVPGASDVFRGSVVSYASEVKYDVLGVPRGPVVTEDAAAAMAEGACRVLGCDVSVAVTGVAGPAEQEGLPVGTVFLATCVGGEAAAVPVRLPGDRERIRQFATISVLNLLRQRLLAEA
ncbi:MAG: competence/damage-inducible protein A [Acidimicrobiales bacterium]|jgi:nicotinamide-nucleotide amidase|nr:competence/damage-inducible protein A [Acidimicrobiales bacterium]